jgi:PKD repeat protein
LSGAPLNMPYYPWMYSAPDGRVFSAGPDRQSYYLNPSGAGEWTRAAVSNGPYRDWGSSVTYAPGRVMIVGGGDPPTKITEIMDLNAGPAAPWQRTGDMKYARKQHNTVVLPDGRVLVVGGTSGAGFNDEAAAVLPAEVWDPATGGWTVWASMARKRLYHSSAVLLADGRVLAAGGGRCGGCTINNFDAEIFSPPYLFNTDGTPAARPAITAAPSAVDFGQSFSVETPDPNAIARVSLVRLPATTHSFNQNQAFDALAFTRTTGALSITAPATAGRVPPGHYMLFVINAAGVPSEAKIVQLRGTVAAHPAPPPPAAPSALRVTALDNAQARLLWSDNSTSETDFLVERCAGAGCTGFVEVGRTPGNVTTYRDGGLTGGATYTYRVRARNDAGASTATPPVDVTMPVTAPAGGVAVINRAASRCLDVTNNQAGSGVPLRLWGCNQSESQTWQVPAAGTAGEFRIYTDYCLDASSGSGSDGDDMIIWPCHGQLNQQWTHTALGELKGINGKCITVIGDPTVNGAGLELGPCTGTTSQKWDVGGAKTDQPPVAQFTTSCTGRQCAFNSTASTDDKGIASRSWNFGDGTGAGDAIEVFKSYPSLSVEKSYTVVLTVTDGAGQNAKATQVVTIPAQSTTNTPPVASFTASCSGLTCTFTDQSTDTDGTIASRAWNWGDGSSEKTAATTVTHSYASGGSRTVTLTVTDNAGATGSYAAAIAPVAPASPISLTATQSKIKALQRVVLRWSGATTTTVVVSRRGTASMTVTVPNNAARTDNSYTDDTGRKGGATYYYRVCESSSATAVCSPEVTVVF